MTSSLLRASAPPRERLIAALATIAASVALAGCSGNTDLAQVRGKITLDGQPLPDAFVVFAPTSKGTTSYGKTDASGHYEMTFTDSERGAWIGENVVRINTGDVASGDKAGPKERVPVVYNTQSTLKVDVKPGENTFDFDLNSKAGKVQAAPIE